MLNFAYIYHKYIILYIACDHHQVSEPIPVALIQKHSGDHPRIMSLTKFNLKSLKKMTQTNKIIVKSRQTGACDSFFLYGNPRSFQKNDSVGFDEFTSLFL